MCKDLPSPLGWGSLTAKLLLSLCQQLSRKKKFPPFHFSPGTVGPFGWSWSFALGDHSPLAARRPTEDKCVFFTLRHRGFPVFRSIFLIRFNGMVLCLFLLVICIQILLSSVLFHFLSPDIGAMGVRSATGLDFSMSRCTTAVN